jgi:sulfhydrogenase subunit delta
MSKTLSIGFFSFTGDEGCMFTVIEALITHYVEWKDLLDVREFRLISSKKLAGELDVAIVEGAISTYKEEEKLREIRKRAKKLVAIGSCAITGMPSGHRNTFSEEEKRRIEFFLKRFGHRPKVVPLKDIVEVDMEVPGCPVDKQKFVEALNELFKEFGCRHA